MTSAAVYIVAALRTPVGKVNGCFQHLRPEDLLATLFNELVQSVPELEASQIEDSIIGYTGEPVHSDFNVARLGSVLAGLPDTLPGMVINRGAESSLEAIEIAAQRIAQGDAQVLIAGGIDGASWQRTQLPVNPKWFAHDEELSHWVIETGLWIEKMANDYGITRQAQDEFSLRSHQLARQARIRDELMEELSPVIQEQHCPHLTQREIPFVSRDILDDEALSMSHNPEFIMGLAPLYQGSLTCGNTAALGDAAAGLLLVSESLLKHYDLVPLARYEGYQLMTQAPDARYSATAMAIETLLARLQLPLSQLQWLELSEVYAATTLSLIEALKLNLAQVNPVGGALALGYATGAMGAAQVTTLVHGLRRVGGGYGLAATSTTLGNGAALALKAC